jgi:hypothetical protein
MIHRMLTDLRHELGAKPLDRARVNALLRQLFTRVVVNDRENELVFHWRHMGSRAESIMWLSK